MKTLFVRLGIFFLLISGFISSVSAYVVPKWEDFIVYTNYSSTSESLNIKIGVNVVDKAKGIYKLEMPIEGKVCKMDMEFSYGSYKIAGECDVDVKKEDLLAQYSLDAEIKDENGTRVFYGKIDFKVKGGYEEDYKWNKLDYTAVYDDKREELALELFLENIKRKPGQDYEITIDFDNKDYTKKFLYNSSNEKLIADFIIDINKEDLDSSYRIDFTVDDEDGKEVEDNRIDIDVESDSDDFDWTDLLFSSSYDENAERLEIIFILEKIHQDPKGSYKMYLELEGEDYDERFRYYEDDNELRAKFIVKMKQEDVKDVYKIKMQVKDGDENRIYRRTRDIQVGADRNEQEENNANNSFDQDIVENEVNAHLYYDEKNERLIVTVFLPGINSYPDKESKAYLEIDGEKEDKVMLYNVSKRILVSVFKINIDPEDLQNSYELNLDIIGEEKYSRDENFIVSSSRDFKIKYKKNEEEDNGDNTSKEVTGTTAEIPKNLVTAIDKYIEKTALRETTPSGAVASFEKTIAALNLYAKKKPKYKNTIEQINYLLEGAIDRYELLY